jgi:hypothetical protein
MKNLSILTFTVAACAFLPSSAWADTKTAKPAAASSQTDKIEVQKITVTNKLVDGKKTWLPSEINVKAGQKVELELMNTLAEPHGFNVPGLAENIVVGGKATQVVYFTPSKKEKIKFSCQLHPAHVGGHINVD